MLYKLITKNNVHNENKHKIVSSHWSNINPFVAAVCHVNKMIFIIGSVAVSLLTSIFGYTPTCST